MRNYTVTQFTVSRTFLDLVSLAHMNMSGTIVVDRVFPLEEVREPMRESRKHFGKIVIRIRAWQVCVSRCAGTRTQVSAPHVLGAR
jgi:hypothetical protein